MSLFGKLPAGTFDASTVAALQAVLDAAVTSGAPDAYAAVVSRSGSWAGAAGVGGADRRAATAEDEFYLVSVTQVFTSALILRLAEQGRIDLDAPLADYLGDLAVDTNGATVRQALAHRSGLPDYDPNTTPPAIQADPRHVWTVPEIASHFGKPTSAPGTVWTHAGPNFVLLGVAAEHASGMSFSDSLRKEILDPVGATRIVQQQHGQVTPMPWALPTEANASPIALADFGADGVISFMSSVSFAFGSGSMAGDASSVAEWAWHLMAGDIVSADSLQAMLPTATSEGMGMERLPFLGDGVIGLTASKTGYAAMLAVVPAKQVVVVFFVNDPDFNYDAFVSELISIGEAG